ncbi:RNA polymerase sigma factor [Prosthecobacter sp.]|jgi:RNA polymerase sigma-70 factor (ECF subfamily)|uniref:RNA polymerase sigma factor n=1 Tax=Prosthecobacter sp. TaxID=1965333 RepID=UPI00378410F8
MPQTELSEEDLLLRVARKDTRAFDQLYDALAPRLYGLLRQMLHDEREAEEVMQDSFVHLWESAGGFDPERGRAFTWAVMLFRHKAIDRMRALGRRTRLVESAALEQAALSAQPPSADEGVMADERRGVVRSALDELPKDQRQLIECAFLKGLTHHVISESLGLPLGTVKTNIRRGLLRLRELLKGGSDGRTL